MFSEFRGNFNVMFFQLLKIYSQSGFICMMFYRRDTHIAEIQMGTPAVRLEDACTVEQFDVTKLPYITLIGTLNHFKFFF